MAPGAREQRIELRDPVTSGRRGEIVLRGPKVFKGYWRDPEATRAAFTPNGAVRTGDLGFIDDAGRLRLVGRSKEMYVRGGYNVYPMEVESVLATHPAISQVAVVSRPDDVMGEIGVAFLVAGTASAAPTLEELRRFAGLALARHKLPDELHLVDELPLTTMDKVDRRELARRARSTGT